MVTIVTLVSALALGCLMGVGLRHADVVAAPPEGLQGADGRFSGHGVPTARSARIWAEVRRVVAVTTTSYVQQVNLARGPSRDPSPA